MFFFLLILFFLCLSVPVFSYLIFPIYIKQKASSVLRKKNDYTLVNDWPEITVVFSVFNEEKVISRKLESILKSDYPKDKLHILIGSDNSTDNTHAIIEEYIKQNNFIRLVKKKSRLGKLKIINELVDLASSEYLILTDANVFFEPITIKALVYTLLVKKAHLAGGNIFKFSPKNQGISGQEIYYMNFENQLKYHESLVYGACVGVEGGCYAIRKDWFVKVPDGFLMDDFFITLGVVEKKGIVLFEPEAKCLEDVNDSPLIEFKRKIRISLGNFRNLQYYKHLLFPIHKGFGFAFFSHKVLRWVTPFALIVSFFLCFGLAVFSPLFILVSLMYSLLVILPLLTIFLERAGVKIPVLNSLGHFILMNFALFLGFVKYISADNDSAWDPPKRNV